MTTVITGGPYLNVSGAHCFNYAAFLIFVDFKVFRKCSLIAM